MDLVGRTSFLLLVILALNVQLSSSAPIYGEFVQLSVAAEEPAEKTPALVATQEELTAELDTEVTAGGPEPASIGDPAPADLDGAESKVLGPQEPIEGRAAIAEAEEAGGAESESSDHLIPAPEEPVSSVPLALEDEAPEEHAESVAIPSPEEANPSHVASDEKADVDSAASQEDPPAGQEEPESVVPLPVNCVCVPLPVETQETGQVDSVVEEDSGPEEPAVIIPMQEQEGLEEHPDANKEPLSSTTEEQEPVLIPAEPETEEGGQVEPAGDETPQQESEDPLIVVPVDDSEQEEQEENILLASSETAHEETLGEHTEEVEAAVPVVLQGDAVEDTDPNEAPPSPPEEEEPVLIPAEPETEEGGQVEPAGDETLQQDSEEPLIIVPVDDTEPDMEEKEENIPLASSETAHEETSKELTEVVEAAVPVVLQGDAEEDPDPNEAPPSPPEEEEPILITTDPESEDVQVEHAGESEDPLIVVPVEDGEQEPNGEEQENVPLVSMETEDEEASEEHAEEVAVPVVLEGEAEEDPNTDKDPSTDEVESAVLLSIKHETEHEEGVKEPAGEESLPEEPVAEDSAPIVPVEAAQAEPEEPAGDETLQQEPEDPLIVVPLDVSEQEPDLEEQETIPLVSSEEHAEEVEANLPAFKEMDAEELPDPNKAPEDDESAVLIPLNHETGDHAQQERGEEEAEHHQDPAEDPVVIVPVGAAEEEPQLEEQDADETLPIDSQQAPEEEEGAAPEAHATEEDPETILVVPDATDDQETAISEELEEEESDVLVPVELDGEEEEPVENEPQDSEEPDEAPQDNTDVELAPVEEEPAVDEENISVVIPATAAPEPSSESHVAPELLGPSEEATHENSEESTAAATSFSFGLEDLNGTITTSNLTASFILEEEPVALVSRGAVLGAALFTLLSFITMGFIWMTISKKLR